jgi:predicted ribosome quality control (RQC) complex YloA/Tae2 family protein
VALQKSLDRWSRRVDDLESAATSESRADTYEAWGHLLMTFPNDVVAGSEEVTVPNVLVDGAPTVIPLDPSRTAIQNAEKYYDKARRLREERAHLSQRLEEAHENQKRALEMLEAFTHADSLKEIERLKKAHRGDLRKFVGGKAPDIDSTPFRRIEISGGFEVWVGRNARENDSLTFEHASRHDLWMHARGVPGSHVVLKVPGRQQKVDRVTKEEAAAIAAWFSRARGSGLVPVQIALRKHVTKPRGAAPGVVRVQNEEVVLVEPGLPKE